ncbi:MAG: AAA family ATPase [Acidimicrobiales bacterium]|jgi:class 3 adenylate cyclase
MAEKTATITVLMTDLVGSTDLLRYGPETYDDIRRAHLAEVRRALANGGTEIKSTGDGVMAVFMSAAEALACGEMIQQAVARLRRRDPRSPAVRVGLSCGEATAEEGDWYGPPVIEAARLCSEAEGSQVLTTSLVAALVGSRGGHRFIRLGERTLKGFALPTDVLALDWEPASLAPLPPAATSSGGFFVGRADEIDRLGRSWKEAESGTRRVVLVAGEPGVGKTRLVAELARAVHAGGGLVLWGRCDEELAVAYQPFAEALRQWVVTASEDEVAGLRARPELGRLLPELGDVAQPVASSAGGDPEGERFLFFDAVGNLLRGLSEGAPALLVLDDLQWASAPTLLLLRHLVRDTAPAALLVVGTYRDTDLDRTHPLAGMLADFRREPTVDRLALGGLSEPAVVEYVEAAAGESLEEAGEELASALYRQTEGNPFFVGQVLRHLTESGALVRIDGRWRATAPIEALGIPEGVREVVGRRLSRLSEGANAALTIGAVTGGEFELRTLEAVADPKDAGALLARVEEAVAAHLVEEAPGSPGRFSFSHALVRQTLLAELTAARRARLHRRIGEALSERRGVSAAVVAYHLCAGASADSVAAALPWVERAIDEVARQAAFEEAAAIGEHALQALDVADDPMLAARSNLLLTTAVNRRFSGDEDRANQLADEAVGIARQAGDPVAFAEALLVRFDGAQIGVSREDWVRLVPEALAGLGEEAPAVRAQLLGHDALYRGVNLGEGMAAEPEARRAVELARESGHFWAQFVTLLQRGSLAMGSPAIAVLQSVLDDMGRLMESPPGEYLGDLGVATLQRDRLAVVARLVQGDRAGAEAAISHVGELARGDGAGRLRPAFVGMWKGMLDLADGRLDSAAVNAAELLPMVESDANFYISWATLMFRIELERGGAGALLPMARSAVEATPELAAIRALLASALVEAGEPDEAGSVLSDLTRDDFAAVRRDVTWSGELSVLAEVCLAVGDRTAAAALYEELVPFAGQVLVVAWGVYCPGAADRYLGGLAGLLGRPEDLDARFAAALELEGSIGATALAARTRVWWARGLIDRGRPGDASRARELLEEATSAAQQLGLVVITREAAQVSNRLSA